jgi:hypothetical protein
VENIDLARRNFDEHKQPRAGSIFYENTWNGLK